VDYEAGKLYVVIIYDVGIERLYSVRHILKQYLTWIQNSAFEGEITLGDLEHSIHFLSK
jgi:CRISPR-associated protein Cas2